jgi:ribonuclease-3
MPQPDLPQSSEPRYLTYSCPKCNGNAETILVSEDCLAAIEQCLGWRFQDRSLLQQALTHPSYSAEQSIPPPDNQRLEFLGDAALGFVVTRLLFGRFPEYNEGMLTRIRSALTRDQALVQYARQLGLGEGLLLGRGEEQGGGRDRPSNLEDAFEALVGALLLDSGLEAVDRVCRALTRDQLEDVHGLLDAENPKGALQEYTQSAFHVTPSYEVLDVVGPEHCPEFEVRVMLGDRELARTRGASRREAEREAAAMALAVLRQENHTDE